MKITKQSCSISFLTNCAQLVLRSYCNCFVNHMVSGMCTFWICCCAFEKRNIRGQFQLPKHFVDAVGHRLQHYIDTDADAGSFVQNLGKFKVFEETTAALFNWLAFFFCSSYSKNVPIWTLLQLVFFTAMETLKEENFLHKGERNWKKTVLFYKAKLQFENRMMSKSRNRAMFVTVRCMFFLEF